jgi:hypothetical protein
MHFLAGGLAAAALASRASADVPGNLLTNPSAEEGTLLSPAGWDTSVTQVPTARFAWDSEQAHDGKHSLYIINTGNVIPVWFNWSQTLAGVNNLAGKELTLRAWVKTRNLSGKAYLLLQAYRDTVLLEAMKQGIPRLRMRDLMHIKPADDPQLEMGWVRKQLSGNHDDWTPLEVKVYVPPSTNMVFVRGGIFGVGEVWFDDFSLTASPAEPEKPFPLAKNLLVDPGFEDDLDQWELSLPPLEGLRVDVDGQIAHSGTQSVRIESQRHPPFQLFSHVCQVFNTRALSGKHVRMSGWVKTDHLDQGSAFFTVVATGQYGSFRPVIPDGVSGTKDWTFLTYECDIPRDTYTVWARAAFTTSEGKVWFDDVHFEVLGDAKTASGKESASRKKS